MQFLALFSAGKEIHESKCSSSFRIAFPSPDWESSDTRPTPEIGGKLGYENKREKLWRSVHLCAGFYFKMSLQNMTSP